MTDGLPKQQELRKTYQSNAVHEARACDLNDDAFAKLIEIRQDFDEESAHGEGDDILCELLWRLGYTKTVEAWDRLGKWYS